VSAPELTTFETPGEVSLRLVLHSADVSVVTWDEPVTEIRVEATDEESARSVSVTSREGRGGLVEVRVEEPKRKVRFGRDPELEIRIACPAGSDLECSGGSSDLKAEGTLGRLLVKTGSGDVRVERVRKPSKVTSASGDVSIGEAEATLTVQTASGDVLVDTAAGALALTAVSGDVIARTVRDGVSLSTVSGDAEIGALVAGDARVQSVSGDVELGVAAGLGVWIDAQSVSGSMASELDLDDEPPSDGRPAELRIRTVSGDVRIVRAGIAAEA